VLLTYEINARPDYKNIDSEKTVMKTEDYNSRCLLVLSPDYELLCKKEFVGVSNVNGTRHLWQEFAFIFFAITEIA
jgi:hypothetical protein